MSCKKDCGYPINPAPIAPGDCGPCGPHRPPRPPMKPGCPPSQYIGSRYVPIFAYPIEWDINKAYESLTIVTYNNESYTSKCNVGPGIDITNERYWAKTGAYNAQVEQYKNAVNDLSSQVTGFASDNKELREKIEKYDKDNAEMKNTVAEDKARVDALAERVSTAESEIDGLQATTAQHTKDIADLTAKDADLQRQITSNDNDIAALQAKDTEQDSRLSAIETVNKAQDVSIAQNTSDIAKNVKNIQDNAANISVNAHEIADHAEKLADHEARLTAQHKEITDNHTAIERNTSDIASLRSDLTEDEAKIESNRDAIAHIQEKDVQQDGRLDALEKKATTAEGRLDGLDTKTDQTNSDLAAEVDRAKAAEVANGKLIAANAAELADHAEKLTDHAKRITALETDNATNKNDISNIIAKNTAQDTAIQAARDAAAHADETATAAKDAADSAKAKADENTQKIAALETGKADKSDIPDVSGFVTTDTYTAGQAAQDAVFKNKFVNPNYIRIPFTRIVSNSLTCEIPIPYLFTKTPKRLYFTKTCAKYTSLTLYYVTRTGTFSSKEVTLGAEIAANLPLSIKRWSGGLPTLVFPSTWFTPNSVIISAEGHIDSANYVMESYFEIFIEYEN